MPPESENHLTQDTPTGNTSGVDVDALMNDIEGNGNRTIGMGDPSTPESGDPAPAAQSTANEFEFDITGKKIKVPYGDPRLKQWAQQGYDYSQKMQSLREERAQWEQAKKELEDSLSPYKSIDSWAKENPEHWNHIVAQWETLKANPAGTDASGQDLPAWAKEKISTHEKFISEIQKERQTAKEKSEDEALQKDVQSIRDQYANLDWNTPDEHGLSLEKRVVKHAIDNGISNFRAAFRDFHFDNLVKLEGEKAKESATKSLQARTRQGIIGQSSTPKKGLTAAQGIKNKSYEDLGREAREELGIA
jgi:hypothetical protein